MPGRTGIFAASVAATLVAFTTPAHALDAQVVSFDGVHITTHFYPAAGLEEGDTAPTDPTAPIKVEIPAQGGEEIVGAPTLLFKYTATGASSAIRRLPFPSSSTVMNTRCA